MAAKSRRSEALRVIGRAAFIPCTYLVIPCREPEIETFDAAENIAARVLMLCDVIASQCLLSGCPKQPAEDTLLKPLIVPRQSSTWWKLGRPVGGDEAFGVGESGVSIGARAEDCGSDDHHVPDASILAFLKCFFLGLRIN